MSEHIKTPPPTLTMGITAHSHLQRVYDIDEALDDLKDALKQCLREPLRRSDRFIQLALLGSIRCLRDQHTNGDCALILTSHYGPVSNNALLQQQLYVEQQIPKPIYFVNTLGNAAGFYIARNLGLAGANHFVSGSHGGFFDALLMAALLLRSGTSLVLLGAVDECVLPQQQHRQRISASSTAPLAEGSHWLLLTAAHDPQARQLLHLHHDTRPQTALLLPPVHYGSELAGNVAAFCGQTALPAWSFTDAAMAPYRSIEITSR